MVEYTVPDSGSQEQNTGSTATFTGGTTSAQTTEHFTAPTVKGTMFVGTLGVDASDDLEATPPLVQKQPVLAEILVPQLSIVASRQETSLATLVTRQKTLVGFLNAASLSIDGQSFAAKTLLCTRISGTTQDGGSKYNVGYEFSQRADWNITAVAIDPATGAPYKRIDEITDGRKSFQVYDTADMSGLSL